MCKESIRKSGEIRNVQRVLFTTVNIAAIKEYADNDQHSV